MPDSNDVTVDPPRCPVMTCPARPKGKAGKQLGCGAKMELKAGNWTCPACDFVDVGRQNKAS